MCNNKFTKISFFLLAISNIGIAQESDSVTYHRSHRPSYIELQKNRTQQGRRIIAKNRKAQLIYSLNYVLLKSSQGTDTIFLSRINKVKRGLLSGKFLRIRYNHYLDCMNMTFRNKKGAKIAMKFLRENMENDESKESMGNIENREYGENRENPKKDIGGSFLEGMLEGVLWVLMMGW